MKPVQSVERAFAVLEVFAAQPCGLSEAARRTGLPKSTVARLVATLESVGGVERIGDRYQIGPAISSLSGSGSGTLGLISLARPHLERLAVATGEAAGLSIADGDHMHTITQVDVDRPVQASDFTGELASIHSVPSGLLMMAEWPPERLDRYLAGPLERSTPDTLTDPTLIRDRLAEVRRQGFAWGKEEYHEGINSVAAPVYDRDGAFVAAVHVHGPAFRFPAPGQENAIGRLVVAAADQVSAARISAS